MRVLITEDSAVVAEILRKILSSDPEIEVVGWAKNGKESAELTAKLRPDVVTMDIRMPVMDGLEATRLILRDCPTPILVISASINREDLSISFDAIKAGALDVIEKPRASSSMSYGDMADELVRRVKIVSRVRPFRRAWSETRPFQRPAVSLLSGAVSKKIVAIGASTGGPLAILKILKGLPASLPVPILAVQHISRGFIQGMVDWLNRECALRAIVARDGERASPGVVYFPDDDRHLSIHPGGELRLNKTLPVNGHRPSIDHMMRSVAATYGSYATGVLLTGMGRDGVEGMQAIKHAGGKTIAQDEFSSVVFGMPKEAIASGVVDRVVPLDDLAAEITAILSSP